MEHEPGEHLARCDHILATRPHRSPFWCRATTTFRVPKSGPCFYLRKQDPRCPLDDSRVIGHAEYLLGETRCVHELSGYFGLNNLGVTSPSELELRLVEIAWDGNPATPGMAGVLRLQGSLHSVDWLALPRSGIPFAANVVQGIGLNEAQVEAPLDTGLYGAVGA